MGLTVYGAGESHTVAAAPDWWDVLWPVVEGCTKVSAGCEHCSAAELVAGYAPELASVGPKGPQWKGRTVFHEERLDNPQRWETPRIAFVCPTSDFFHGSLTDRRREEIWARMVDLPQHTFVIVTKRSASLRSWWQCHTAPSHIWPVVSVESQALMQRADDLLCIDAAVRGVSCEPLLGCIEFGDRLGPLGINWLVAGPELGPWARPCAPLWMRSLRNQAHHRGVPFFTKHRIDGKAYRGMP